MPAPAFSINDQVVFVAPFDTDTNVYRVYAIQYFDENNELTEGPTENFQYLLATGLMASVEAYITAAP
jgi:hypothetical protein